LGHFGLCFLVCGEEDEAQDELNFPVLALSKEKKTRLKTKRKKRGGRGY
jgi:hypothetical protein